jgi:hypothetical protein
VKQTHEALPIIIDELRKKGYEFVTVTDLLQEASVQGNEVRDQAWLKKQLEYAIGL